MSIIPKILHFIWIGNEKPKWVDFSINSFKKINPDFEVKLWNYNKLYIDNSNDYLSIHIHFLIDILNKYINKTNYYSLPKLNDIVLDRIRCLWWSQLNLILSKPQNAFIWSNKSYTINTFPVKLYSAIGDVLKWYILYKNGGIYIDCDTFPTRPFDDALLKESFWCFKDSYFLGSIQNEQYCFIRDLNWKYNNKIKMLPRKIKWPTNKQKNDFYNCTLEYHEDLSDEQYIYHFVKRSWW